MEIQGFSPTDFEFIQLGYFASLIIPMMLGFALIAKFKKTMDAKKKAGLYWVVLMVGVWSSVFYVFLFALSHVNSEYKVYMEDVKQDLLSQGVILEGELPKWDEGEPMNVKLINSETSYNCTVTYPKNAEYLDFKCEEAREVLNLQDIFSKS